MTRAVHRLASSSLLLTLICGCATAPKSGVDRSAASAIPSSVDIAYVLGHNQRRIHAESGEAGTVAQAFMDRQMIEQGAIDHDHYAGFLTKASSFIDQAPKEAQDTPCRSPFTVTVKVGEDTKISRGCRSSEEAAISHLVRDGEVLLSSKRN